MTMMIFWSRPPDGAGNSSTLPRNQSQDCLRTQFILVCKYTQSTKVPKFNTATFKRAIIHHFAEIRYLTVIATFLQSLNFLSRRLICDPPPWQPRVEVYREASDHWGLGLPLILKVDLDETY
ncbi:hypothetical protein LIPSTDRAFT_102285 [Lipomyces starkeyi NRRL Y-11557]|uniref:Uncharacterized protein n=1 Tax=Lipomyces starkeyi NRRL Y-11557 TaxID=675824 RepID=A0A1E3QCW4_LIPST|nr:hypothetical protein LIPSTDRAFT_102285 [Lipomyces starkeyi NRRL Y-11557]